MMDLSGELIIKAHLGDDIRRIPIHNDDITYDELILMMQRVFKEKISNNDDLLIKYKDEDGDYITIADESDLSFAIKTKRVLQIKIFVRGDCPEKSLDNDLNDKLNLKHRMRPLKDCSTLVAELRNLRDQITMIIDNVNDYVQTDAPESNAVKGNLKSSVNDSQNMERSREFDPLSNARQAGIAGFPGKTQETKEPLPKPSEEQNLATSLASAFRPQPTEFARPPMGDAVKPMEHAPQQPQQLQQQQPRPLGPPSAPFVPGPMHHQNSTGSSGSAMQQQQQQQQPGQPSFAPPPHLYGAPNRSSPAMLPPTMGAYGQPMHPGMMGPRQPVAPPPQPPPASAANIFSPEHQYQQQQQQQQPQHMGAPPPFAKPPTEQPMMQHGQMGDPAHHPGAQPMSQPPVSNFAPPMFNSASSTAAVPPPPLPGMIQTSMRNTGTPLTLGGPPQPRLGGLPDPYYNPSPGPGR